MKDSAENNGLPKPGWTFLSNHAHVLLCILKDPTIRIRDLATRINITERAVQSIIRDLKETGYLKTIREGRRNRYSVEVNKPLRHPIEKTCNISELFSHILKDI